jgi:hypothetical protein
VNTIPQRTVMETGNTLFFILITLSSFRSIRPKTASVPPCGTSARRLP